MKKLISIILLFVFIFLINLNAGAQQVISEGKVIYHISYPDMEMDPQMAAMMPSESVVYFKDHLSRTEMSIGSGIHSITILNSKTNEITTLMDMMGTKTATVISEDQKNKEKKSGNDNSFELLNESKEIAGYMCKKAVMKNSDGSSLEIFYTDKILSRSQFGKQWKNFKGFPMEYQVAAEGFNMKLKAIKVSAEKVSDDQFKIPPEYKLMTQEEFSKMLGEEEKK